MDYLGDKLSVAQSHMTQWVGTVRRSFQEALHVVTATVGTERSGENAGRTPFKRTSSFRHLASRSRESFRRFSVRSQQRFSSLRKRQQDSEAPDLVSWGCVWFKIAGLPWEGPLGLLGGADLQQQAGKDFFPVSESGPGTLMGSRRLGWLPWRCNTPSLLLMGNQLKASCL